MNRTEDAGESSFPATAPADTGATRRPSGRRQEADHDLVMATARRVIASDAAIIHRLGTV